MSGEGDGRPGNLCQGSKDLAGVKSAIYFFQRLTTHICTTRNSLIQRELAQARLELAEMEAEKDDLEVQLVNLLQKTSQGRK